MTSKAIGFLVATDPSIWKKYTNAFEAKLGRLGWNIVGAPTVNPKDVFIDYEPANGAKGDPTNFANALNKFTSTPVDVIVTSGITAAKACQAATTTIPIVFASVGDIAGLSGANLTGGWNQQVDVNHVNARVKHLLDEFADDKPGTSIKKLVVIYNDTPSGSLEQALVMRAAAALNPSPRVVRNQTDIQAIPTTLVGINVDAFYVCSDPVITEFVADLETACGNIFTAHAFAEYIDGRAVNHKAAYGPNMRHMFRTAAGYVDQILRAGTPAQALLATAALPIFLGDIEQRP
jgi:putative tryptophan/tyrosine transport system substrate-binding protein